MSLLRALSGLFSRGMENPSTPMSDPDEWLVEALGGGVSSSGVRVTNETALNYAAVWRAVNLISRDVAKLPLFVYRRKGDGLERDAEHPAFKLLRYQANPGLTAFQFRMTLQSHALLWGNGYAVIRRQGLEPTGLYILSPDLVTMEGEVDNLRYVVQYNAKDRQVYEPYQVLHIRGLGTGYQGKSIVSVARDSLGIGLAAQKYAGRFYSNYARPSAVIEHPEHLSDDAMANLKRSWSATYGGSDNYGKVAILEEGMKLNAFSMSHEDAQFLETRQFEIREIANWFGVPPHKLGDTTRTAFASLEQENQSYLDDALDGWLCNWEAELRLKLLSEPQQQADSHVIEFMRQALVRTNLQDRGQYYMLAVTNGWMSRDEVRARESLNPIPDGEGEAFLIPLNMQEVGEEPPQGPQTAPESIPEPEPERVSQVASEAASEALKGLLADVTRRMSRRIATHARKAAKRPDQFIPWLESELETEHRPAILEAVEPVAGAIRAVCGSQATAAGYADAFLEACRSDLFSATDYPPAELDKRVCAICDKLEGRLIPVVNQRFFTGGTNGQDIHAAAGTA